VDAVERSPAGSEIAWSQLQAGLRAGLELIRTVRGEQGREAVVGSARDQGLVGSMRYL